MGKGLKEIPGIQPELREKIVMPAQAVDRGGLIIRSQKNGIARPQSFRKIG